jgi:hypothetical protein
MPEIPCTCCLPRLSASTALPSPAFATRGTARRRVDSASRLTAATIGLPCRRKPNRRDTTLCSATAPKGGLEAANHRHSPYGNVILIRTVWTQFIRKMLAYMKFGHAN